MMFEMYDEILEMVSGGNFTWDGFPNWLRDADERQQHSNGGTTGN